MKVLDVYDVDEFVIEQEEISRLTEWIRANGNSVPVQVKKTIEKLIHKELYRDFLTLQ